MDSIWTLVFAAVPSLPSIILTLKSLSLKFFISGYNGCNAVKQNGTPSGSPNHYSGKVFRNGKMVAGSGSMPGYNEATIPGNAGHGYARFTLVSIVSSN